MNGGDNLLLLSILTGEPLVVQSWFSNETKRWSLDHIILRSAGRSLCGIKVPKCVLSDKPCAVHELTYETSLQPGALINKGRCCQRCFEFLEKRGYVEEVTDVHELYQVSLPWLR